MSYAIAVEAAAADDEADAANELAMSTEDIPEALAAVRERLPAHLALEAIGRIKSVLNIRHPRLFGRHAHGVGTRRLAVLHDEERLTPLQELHGDVTRRIASIPESSETLETRRRLRAGVRLAVVELDRLVREALRNRVCHPPRQVFQKIPHACWTPRISSEGPSHPTRPRVGVR